SVDNHSTHYRPIRDSLKIFWVVIRNFGLYLFSGMISGLVDITAFYLLSAYVMEYVFPGSPWLLHLGATVVARVISSVVNFLINYKLVFCGASKASFIKYYVLWGAQLGASFGLSGVVKMSFSLNDFHASLAKFGIDLLLGILSYQIQNAWVFKRVKKGKFFGPSALFARFLVRTFTPKYRCNVLPYDEPVLYVARHLDMRGAAATLGFLKFHVHPMILSVFFTKKECYKQYAEYTFTARHGKPRKKFNLRAWLLSRLVPMGIKSTKGVPVYRDFTKMKRTFDIATDYLLKGESLIVYPDIEYTAGSDKVSEIYDGFLYLTETYRFKTGKSLRIVPIHVNEKNGTLDEQSSLYIENFRIDRKPMAEHIKYAINGMTPPASEDN
ncbi:MAG: GtrA family protein, partial [Clostridia bacterium]|nr:GtrA family protein [Clostridia bacterium]